VPTQLAEKEKLIGNFIGYAFLVFLFVVLSPISVGIVVFAPLRRLVARYAARRRWTANHLGSLGWSASSVRYSVWASSTPAGSKMRRRCTQRWHLFGASHRRRCWTGSNEV
jgi:hypothetical protein